MQFFENSNTRSLLRIITFAFIVFCVPSWGGEAANEKLFEALKKVDVDGVKAALKLGASPNAVSNDKRPMSALGLLVLYGSPRPGLDPERVYEIANLLFSKGAKLGALDGETLYFPIASGDEKLTKILLDHKASPTRKMEGLSPAEIALQNGHENIYRLLLSRGATPVSTGGAAQLQLVEAAGLLSEISAMKAAISKGAKINSKDAHDQTALIAALRNPILKESQAAGILWLLDNGADPNITGESGFQGLDGIPLHLAVAMNMNVKQSDPRAPLVTKVIKALLAKGAKVSAADSQDKTPLHHAAKYDDLVGAEILINEEARVDARDKLGKTPMDYAESKDMIQLLKKHGAK